ncbi:MAG: hypothetical protein V5A31_10095 [Haloferacaceae archaeon]
MISDNTETNFDIAMSDVTTETTSQSSNLSQESGSSQFTIPKHQFATNLLLHKIDNIPQTRRVYQRFDDEGGVVEVWVIFEEEDRDARKEIYGIEYDLIEFFEDIELILHVAAEEDITDLNLANNSRLLIDKDVV